MNVLHSKYMNKRNSFELFSPKMQTNKPKKGRDKKRKAKKKEKEIIYLKTIYYSIQAIQDNAKKDVHT